VFACLASEPFGPSPALDNAEEAGVSQLAAGRVLAHALPCLFRISFDIEQIIDNLERQAETSTVAVQSFQQLRRRRSVSVGVGRQRPQTQHARTPDPREQIGGAVRGQYPITVEQSPDVLRECNKQGVGKNVEFLAPDSPMGHKLLMSFSAVLMTHAPHPNAAKLWQEFLYSPHGGQNGWLKGAARPIELTATARRSAWLPSGSRIWGS